jgi:hypothetical protein
MHSKFRTTFATAAAAALVLGSVSLASADVLEIEGDELDATGTLALGDICLGESNSGSILLRLKKTGTNTNTYGDGAEVSITSASTSSVVTSTALQSVLLTGWATATNNSYQTLGTPTITASLPEGGPLGAGTASIEYTSSGTSAPGPQGTTTLTRSATVAVTWNAVDCAPSDDTAPEISYVLSPSQPDGDDGWYKSDVTLEWTVTEEESPSSLEKTGCVDQSITEDQFETSYSCSATSDGGSAGPVEVKIKRDATAPTITWGAGSPADGASYYFGDAIPTADCTADDATSGVNADGCEVTGGGTAVGSHTLTAKATDHAGNETIETRTYTVLAWTLDGFYRPVDMGKVNTVKAGSTVPLKFNVFKGDERLTSGIGASFSAKKMNCESGAVEDMIEEIATTGKTELRYDADGQQWVQNWATPKSGGGSCYLVKMTTADGTSITADFKLK